MKGNILISINMPIVSHFKQGFQDKDKFSQSQLIMNSLSSKYFSLNVNISVMLKFLLISLMGQPDMKLTDNFHLVKPYSCHITGTTGSLTEKLRIQGMDCILYSPLSSIHTISIDFISFPACQSLLAFIHSFYSLCPPRFYKIP